MKTAHRQAAQSKPRYVDDFPSDEPEDEPQELDGGEFDSAWVMPGQQERAQ